MWSKLHLKSSIMLLLRQSTSDYIRIMENSQPFSDSTRTVIVLYIPQNKMKSPFLFTNSDDTAQAIKSKKKIMIKSYLVSYTSFIFIRHPVLIFEGIWRPCRSIRYLSNITWGQEVAHISIVNKATSSKLTEACCRSVQPIVLLVH